MEKLDDFIYILLGAHDFTFSFVSRILVVGFIVLFGWSPSLDWDDKVFFLGCFITSQRTPKSILLSSELLDIITLASPPVSNTSTLKRASRIMRTQLSANVVYYIKKTEENILPLPPTFYRTHPANNSLETQKTLTGSWYCQ